MFLECRKQWARISTILLWSRFRFSSLDYKRGSLKIKTQILCDIFEPWLIADTLLLLDHLFALCNTHHNQTKTASRIVIRYSHRITCCTSPCCQHRQSRCPPRSAPWSKDSDWEEQCPTLPCYWTFSVHIFYDQWSCTNAILMHNIGSYAWSRLFFFLSVRINYQMVMDSSLL